MHYGFRAVRGCRGVCLCSLLCLAPAVLRSAPTELDLSQASVSISDTGASGGGLAQAEVEVNEDGYVIGQTDHAQTTTLHTISILATCGVVRLTLAGINIEH